MSICLSGDHSMVSGRLHHCITSILFSYFYHGRKGSRPLFCDSFFVYNFFLFVDGLDGWMAGWLPCLFSCFFRGLLTLFSYDATAVLLIVLLVKKCHRSPTVGSSRPQRLRLSVEERRTLHGIMDVPGAIFSAPFTM